MTWLSEDPWPLAGGLGVVALALVAALWFTQQGKFLVYAGVAFLLGLAVLAIEALWVTDRERIEGVVYGMAAAVERSDPDAVIAYLAPDYEVPGGAFGVVLIRSTVNSTKFDFVNIRSLKVQAGKQSRQGKADFLVMASWARSTALGGTNFDATPPPGVGFSLGFREVEPDVWKVTRIDLTQAPAGVSTEDVMRYLR